MLAKRDQQEFIGQIIDIFECFRASEDDDPFEVYIYGDAYDHLASELQMMMTNWRLFDSKWNGKILENIVEMSTLYQHLLDKEYLLYEDPVTHEPTLTLFKNEVEEWASEFELAFEDGDEYITEIAVFTEKKFEEKGWLRAMAENC